jgi:tetratricopeptide (TPR) repeat protein
MPLGSPAMIETSAYCGRTLQSPVPGSPGARPKSGRVPDSGESGHNDRPSVSSRLLAWFLFACLLIVPIAAQPRPALTPQAAQLFNQAVDAFHAGNLDVAVQRLRQAEQAAPGYPDIVLYLGLFLYEKNNDSAEAQRYMEAALPQFPAHPDLPLKLLNSYLLTGKLDKIPSLLAGLKPRLEQDPRFAFNVIYTLVQRGQLGTAQKELGDQSRRLQGEIQFLGGLIAANGGQKTQALGLFENAAQNGFPPPASRQTAMLADALFQLQEFRRAADAYDTYFKNFPQETAYPFRAALCYYAIGDFLKAKERLEQVLKKVPNAPEANYYLGCVLIELKQVMEAEPYFQAELKNDPRSFKAMTKIAYLHYLKGENDESRTWLDKSLALSPDWFESHVVSGLLHSRSGENEQAIQSFEKAVQEEPGYPKAYYQLSIAYKRAGNDQKAQQALETYNRLQSAETARAMEALGMPRPREQR